MLIAGCATSIDLQLGKEWEGRYTSKNTIAIDGKTISIDKDTSVWVLTDKSMNALMEALTKKK